MNQRYKPYDPDQQFLLPPSLREWLPEDHLAYFVSDTVDELNLSAITQAYERADPRGQPPYHPRMMVKLLVYGYCVGVASSRKIEQRTHEDMAFRVLVAGQHPDHDTIAAFRKQHLKALEGLFVQAVRPENFVRVASLELAATVVHADRVGDWRGGVRMRG